MGRIYSLFVIVVFSGRGKGENAKDLEFFSFFWGEGRTFGLGLAVRIFDFFGGWGGGILWIV